jgi:SWI/SNF-related matrix-associated actin-dependent regulator of chromatin subfamily A-like protein 1
MTPDQIAGADFLASRTVAMLADRPGLGKTAQAVHAADLIGARRGLVICPPILRDNIAREFALWSVWGHDVHVIRSGRDEIPPNGFAAISYQLALSRRKELRKRGADFLICDEAHALKEVTARRTKAVLGADGIAANASRMAWLTGTPAPNNASELYTFAKAAGVWTGNKSAFVDAFCITTQTPFGLKIVGNRNAEGLKELLRPAFLRRTKIDGLPPLRLNNIPIAGDARAAERGLDAATRAALENAVSVENWQFFDVPFIASIRRATGLAKAESAADLVIAELDGGEPRIVVFAQHVAVIATLRERIADAGFSVEVLDGRTPQSQRTPIVDKFQAGGLRALVCQTQAASEGLTFTAASRVILAEPAWTPKENEQMIARVWRKGQSQDVRASMLSLAGSLDDRILKTLDRKMKMIAELF